MSSMYTKPNTGKKIHVLPGNYEVINYTYEGASHSGVKVQIGKIIEGLVLTRVFEGVWMFNVLIFPGSETTIGALFDSTGAQETGIIIAVMKDEIVEK